MGFYNVEIHVEQTILVMAESKEEAEKKIEEMDLKTIDAVYGISYTVDAEEDEE